MSSDRRREPRISGSMARFRVHSGETTTECKVINLSRLGLGVEIPEGFAWENGTTLAGTLQLGEASLLCQAVVRVRRGTFVGLEYIDPSPAFLKDLIAVLTPAYIADSIFPIAPEHLGPHVESVFHGDEFEAVLFKAGRAGQNQTMQFFVGGEMVEFSSGGARIVPSPLVRSANAPGGYDFVTKLSAFSASNEEATQLERTLIHLQHIVTLWQDCPPAIRKSVEDNCIRYCGGKQ